MLRNILCIATVVSSLYIIKSNWVIFESCHQTLAAYRSSWRYSLDYYGKSQHLSNSLEADDNFNWILETNDFVPNQYQGTPYVSNGYIGQRLPAEGVGYWIHVDEDGKYIKNSWPLDQPRSTFGTIAGFWNLQERTKHVLLPDNLKRGGESVISGIADWTGLILVTSDSQIYAPGVDKGTVKAFHQSLSIRNGIVHTNITWSPGNDDDSTLYQLNFTVLAHRTRPNLGIVRLDLSSNEDANCSLIDVLDGAGAVRARFANKGFEQERNSIWTSVQPVGIDNNTAYVFSTVTYWPSDSQLLASVDRTRKDATSSPWVSHNLSTVAQSWDVHLSKDTPVTIMKFVGIASSDAFPHDPFTTAMQSAIGAKNQGWDSLISEHERGWETTWDSADIVVPGDIELQTGVRGSLFHLLTNLRSANAADESCISDNSITVGGLSSDSYAGLVFWDADTWVYPSMLALHPDLAMTINNYRTRLLPQAIANAQSYNYSGALFPWTSGRFGNCTGTGVCKDYQYHLNTDIALAHWQYFQHTHDVPWLSEKGWPIIKNVADMFAAYVVLNETTGEYETLLLGEPDEFAYFKNNGAYTNAGIKKLLGEIGPAAAELLNQTIPQNWSLIAERIRIPIDRESNITLGFDGMQGDWEVKQASVALMNYPLDYRITEDHARNDMTYYSAKNTPDGPAMTWSIFAISEAQLQQCGCAAYTYLLRSGEPYFRSPFYQFSETAIDNLENSSDFNPAFPYGLHPAFPFLTGAGGYLQVFTHGLTGMRPYLDFLYLDPTLLPQIPGGVIVKGLKWQGASIDISIQLEETTITRRRLFTFADNLPVTLHIGDRHADYKLLAGESLKVPTRRPDLNSTLYDGQVNLAQCKKVTSNSEPAEQGWVFGRYPASVVDGSNATVWQPLATARASIRVDLGYAVDVSGMIINWGSAPARSFSVHGYEDVLEDTTGTGTAKTLLYETSHVNISAPFDPKDVFKVRIREGNTTVVHLSQQFRTREISLTIEGTQGEEQRLGATVAELIVF